ncbi:WD repeat-containing protein 34 [Eufriesea mexicana]|uniref:WD repeat-containing protein 34 n=1 Tax=Eufriesea mexicana TaxID=516756 RepID=A0A310SP20_9HYME|nr:WD repeat-containing protein 34 [Eufriesea mexicana]
MFTNRSLEAVSFNSQLSTTKSQLSTNIQTTEIVYNQTPAQAVETRDVEIQTTSVEKMRPEINYEKLAEFLNKVTPNVLEVLDKAYGTNSFEDYEPNTEENSLTSTQFLQKIRSMESKSKMKVSDMSWSISGRTLAVSYKEDCKSLPSACVTSLAYHPTRPSIIAAGLFNGDVHLWNLNDVSVAPVIICHHEDSISQVYWKAGTVNVSFLISSSKDGYIFMHKIAVSNISRVSKRLKIVKEYNPRENSRPRSAGGTRERAMESGLCITAFDFSSRDPIFFIVGTLCGGIYKCSLDRVAPIENDETVMDPVIGEYESHEGSITCIKCSPIRNIFVTAGTDKEIRIYDFEELTSLRSISSENTIVGLTWMMGNQDILATYGAGSNIRLYNVTDGRSVTNVNFEKADRENTSCLRVNFKK